MPRVQLPAVAPKRKAWNKGRIIGQKRPRVPKPLRRLLRNKEGAEIYVA